jgi:hypothetical protein
MALHEDSFCALCDRAPFEGSFEVAVFGEAPKDDLDGVLPLLHVTVGDVGKDTASRSLNHKRRIRRVQERHNGAGGLVDYLLDELERVFRTRTETDERNIRLFARSDRSNLADLDLRSNHLMPETGDKRRDVGQPVLPLVRDEHAETVHFYALYAFRVTRNLRPWWTLPPATTRQHIQDEKRNNDDGRGDSHDRDGGRGN